MSEKLEWEKTPNCWVARGTDGTHYRIYERDPCSFEVICQRSWEQPTTFGFFSDLINAKHRAEQDQDPTLY